MNRAGNVVRHLRSKCEPEMCTVAWAKMYETIVTYDLFNAASLKASSKPTATAHLCEAPGRHFAQLYTQLACIFSLRYTGHIHKAALVTPLLLRYRRFYLCHKSLPENTFASHIMGLASPDAEPVS